MSLKLSLLRGVTSRPTPAISNLDAIRYLRIPHWTILSFTDALVSFEAPLSDKTLESESTKEVLSAIHKAVLEGRVFDCGELDVEKTDDNPGTADNVQNLLQTESLRLPFPTTVYVMKSVDSHPFGDQDEDRIAAYVAHEQPGRGMVFASIRVFGRDASTCYVVISALVEAKVELDGWDATLPGGSPALPMNRFLSGAVISAVADYTRFIADGAATKRVAPDPALVNACLRRGKPAPMGHISLEGASPYTTKLRGGSAPDREDKGGTHASPVPHDRRGHPRHLANGKVVWVRPCRVREGAPETRVKREYYQAH